MRLRKACIVASLFMLAVANATSQNATINYGAAQQTIRGFGGATAWLGQLTVPQADALFSPTSGLGLSVLRVRIDPTGSSTSTPPWATTAPNTGSWFDEVTNAKNAVAANANAIVMATPWTAPASLKSSSSSQPFFNGTCGTGTGFCGGFLLPANYATYAQYLEDFVTYFDNTAGFDLYAISMQNEPDFANVDYESCNWTAAQMDTWIAGNASVLTTRLIMPESFQFIQAQSNTALEDPAAEPLISIIGGHLYGASPSVYTLAQQDSKPLWMTEHMFTPAGSQPVITDALQLAEEINNSMTVGNYSAYVYWWIWDDPNDGINYGLINSNTTAPTPTYYGYAIGQYSKFIQPGYVMVSSTEPISGVLDSAYMGDGNLVIVAINENSTATSFPVTIQGQSATSFTPFQTSATNTMTQLAPVSVTGGSFTYTLPAQSITTFVASSSTTPGFTLSPSPNSVSVTQGKSATGTVSIADLGGFSGSVNLAASGLPAGVTATFGTSPATSSSVVTFTASSTATTGPATVTVTGTSGTSTASTTIALTVVSATGSFSLAPSASTLSVTAGGSATDTIAVTDVSPFAGSVTLAASSLPTGVTAAFGTNPATGTSVVTFAAGSTAAAGTSTVTITGTSGSVTASTTIAITVSSTTASACTVDYTISPQNTSQFGAAIVIKNGGSTALSNWTLTWSFANGQTIAQSWNGTVSQSGANITVAQQTGQTWENIPAGGSYSGFGFNGAWNGVTNAIPTAFSLNGTACTVN